MSKALAGVIDDLCHTLGIERSKIRKVEVFPTHIEVWIYGNDYVLTFRYHPIAD